VRVNVFIAIGVVFAVIGLLGVTYIFPKMMCISGQDFNEKLTKDANGIETFEGYDDGDSFTMVDAISRIQYEFDEAGKTSVWLESIGKSNSDSRFLVSQNIMEDYGVGSEVVLTFEVSTNSDNSQILVNDEISSRYSTTNEYIFMILILGGVGSICYGGYTAFIGKDEEPQDDWGFPAQAPTQSPVAAPPMAAAPVAPPMGGPPAAAPVAPPAAVPPVSSNEPTSMTITVPPGVVPGQVLTVGLPDGRTVNVQVPAGCNAGSQFTITVN
tara:strand:- start:1528 stop:2334 length:807 start_codon:yes stop_codon:yes gene_type:complete